MNRVSVIVPVYNCERYIAKAVDSVLAQTYRDFELIVVDDGSTDRTAEILKGYGKKLTYIYQPNRERAAARNTGIRQSQGEYLAFLDADDLWLPHKLEQQVEAMECHWQVGLVYSHAYVVDANGNPTEAPSCVLGTGVAEPQRLFETLLFDNPIPSPTPMMRKSCLDQVGPFDESLTYIEDREMWLRLALFYDFFFIPEVLAGYRDLGERTYAKWSRYKVTEILPKAIQGVFERFPEASQKFGYLKRGALAGAHWWAGWEDYKRRRFSQSRYYLMLALWYQPSLWSPLTKRMTTKMGLRLIAGEKLLNWAHGLIDAISIRGNEGDK